MSDCCSDGLPRRRAYDSQAQRKLPMVAPAGASSMQSAVSSVSAGLGWEACAIIEGPFTIDPDDGEVPKWS